MQIKLPFGKREFIAEVEQNQRKRLTVTVHPNQKITVKAPLGLDFDCIYQRLQKKASWISRQVDYFENYRPTTPPRKYVSGETHYYLGRQYRLRIRESERSEVKLKGRFFEMTMPNPSDGEKAKKLMLEWYSSHAKELIKKQLQTHLPYFLRMGAEEPSISFRRMKKRWGSWNNNGRIIFNTELAKAPLYCIDYVIVHELCHLLCPRHDSKFYRLLRRLLPDWERRKERLEKVVI